MFRQWGRCFSVQNWSTYLRQIYRLKQGHQNANWSYLLKQESWDKPAWISGTQDHSKHDKEDSTERNRFQGFARSSFKEEPKRFCKEFACARTVKDMLQKAHRPILFIRINQVQVLIERRCQWYDPGSATEWNITIILREADWVNFNLQ